MVFSHPGRPQRRKKMAQRFDTLAAQGVDGVIIAGAIDRGSELRERAAEAGCRWCSLPRASYLDDVDLIPPGQHAGGAAGDGASYPPRPSADRPARRAECFR